MAITLTTTPDSNVAAFAPVTLAGTTTRNPFTNGLRAQKTVSAYANSGGYLQLTVASTTGWLADDVVTISGSSNTAYNTRHTVTSLTSTTLTLATAYNGAATSGVGVVYRTNDGLNIKVEIENATSTVVATIYANVDTYDGSFSVDISRALQYELSSYFDLTPLQIATTTASHEYTIVIYESWLDEDYVVTEDAHGTEPTTIAHLTTELPADDNFQCGNFWFDDKILIHYVSDTTNDVQYAFEYSDGTTAATAKLTETNWHYAYVLNLTSSPDIEWVKVTAQQYIDSQWEDVSDPILVRRLRCNDTILYYMDRYGNYIGYMFHDYENKQRTKKVDRYTGESWLERTLYGFEYMNGEWQDIRDVITSPEVYDEDETLVRVLTDTLTYKAQEVTPSIIVRYDENYISQPTSTPFVYPI